MHLRLLLLSYSLRHISYIDTAWRMTRLTSLLAVVLAICLSFHVVSTAAHPYPPTITTATAPLAPIPTAHIFLIAGQSNSVGYNTDPFTSEDAIKDRIWQLTVCASNNTTLPLNEAFLNVSADPLEPCTSHTPHIGFGRSFARSLLPSLPADDVVVLVPAGLSGTGFVDRIWTAYIGSGFKRAVERLKTTWQLLLSPNNTRGQQYNVTWSGVLWHQGEADAGDNAANEYVNTSYHLHTNLIPLINALRNTSTLPFTRTTLPFIVGQLLPSWLNNASHTERLGVGVAIGMVTQYVGYTGLADSYGLLGDPVFRSGASGQVIHFTGRSQRILGKRYYAAYRAALVNYPEQPTNTSSSEVSQHVEDSKLRQHYS